MAHPDTTPRRELARIEHTLAALRALDEAALAAHAGELRGARTVLVDVLERALGRRVSAEEEADVGATLALSARAAEVQDLCVASCLFLERTMRVGLLE